MGNEAAEQNRRIVERFVTDPSDRPFLVYLAHKAIHPNVIQRDDGTVVRPMLS